jgi:DNA polymerase-3 subunit epsilon
LEEADSMKTASAQFDLFDAAPGYREVPRAVPRKRAAARAPVSASWNAEEAARRLEEGGDYRVLRRLVPRPIVARNESRYPKLAVLVDTETTGLYHARDEVIEIGAVAFTYDDGGKIGDVVGVYSGLRQPSSTIPPEITRLTGITDAMVAGQAIDIAALDALIEPADLIIAHNAGFDRPFCEKLSPAFVPKAWACSVTEVRWADLGFEGNKLGCLVGQSGLSTKGIAPPTIAMRFLKYWRGRWERAVRFPLPSCCNRAPAAECAFLPRTRRST